MEQLGKFGLWMKRTTIKLLLLFEERNRTSCPLLGICYML